MKAAIYTSYGPPDVVQITDVEKPVPKDNEVLIKVRAASVNPLDWRLMKGEPRAMRIMARLLKMPIGRPGVDMAGEIEAVGSNVTQFKPGDAVFGAHVTGVCSTRNVDMVRSIGADEVIDYTRNDFTRGEQRYDLILDCVGNHSFSECRRVLNPEGRCIMIGAPHDVSMIGLLAPMIKTLVVSPFTSQKAVMFIAKASQDHLKLLGEFLASGKLEPVIDSTYSLSEAAEAVRRVEEGHARGKVIITLDGANEI